MNSLHWGDILAIFGYFGVIIGFGLWVFILNSLKNNKNSSN